MDWETGLKRGPFSEIQAQKLTEIFTGLDQGQVQWLCGYLTGISPFLEIKNSADSKPAALSSTAKPVWILYGTHTGNSERLAKLSAKTITENGLLAKVSDMASFKIKELSKISRLLIIVSTHGIGEPPSQAEELYQYLHGNKAPKLDHLSFSVLALGDTGYSMFCQTGKDFDAVLEKLGAKRLHERVDCDVDMEDDYTRWMQGVLRQLQVASAEALPSVGAPPAANNNLVYSRKNPFSATILKKINLNGRNSSKETIHLEIDLKNSGLRYQPGDALGIYALNSKRSMQAILDLLKFSGEEKVETHKGEKTLSEALTSDYELSPLTSVSLTRYAELTDSHKLKKIASDNTSLMEYLRGRDVYDLLKEVPFHLSPEMLVSVLRKNSPRMYSIASCQEAVDDEVHVLVSVLRYQANGRYREGFCSSFLSDRIHPDDKLKVFVDPNSRFRLPANSDLPIIMVGAGTGVAPYRAFMQHRELSEARGKSWLFFGERNFTTDFLYQTEWLRHLKDGVLTKADVAFSRDQDKKVYVQHKMRENGKELFAWLEEGAHFYVCGDAQQMAKDVDRTLRQIIQTEGGMSEDKAAEYLKYLQVSDRYQTDIY